MRDPVGTFFAMSFLLTALAVFFFGREMRLRAFAMVSLCALAVVVLARDRITELIVSYREVKVTLSRVENRLDEIAAAMETLVIAQEINELGPDNSVLLDYEPVPQSVRIIVGPLTHFPRPGYGYRMEGRRIFITEPGTLRAVAERLPGGVTVEVPAASIYSRLADEPLNGARRDR